MGSKVGTTKVAAARLGMTLKQYQDKIAQGLKWCWKCKRWQPITSFTIDRSRGDGLAAKCYDCRRVNQEKPSKRKRRKMHSQGIAWCGGCKKWFKLKEIRNAKCRLCRNAYARKRYAEDEAYREERKNHRDKHRRGVERVPPEGRLILLEDSLGMCVYCGQPATAWDHIVPVSQGGITTPGNIVPSCIACNSSKKDHDVLEWLDRTGRKPHPLLCNRMELSAME